MEKMYIKMKDENLTPEQVAELDNYFNNIFAKMRSYKDEYGCYTNGTFETFGAIYWFLSKLDWFMDNVNIWLWIKQSNGKCVIENILEDKHVQNGFVLMHIRFNKTKLKYADTTADKILQKYNDYCTKHNIYRPQEDVFVATGEHALATIGNIMFDLGDSDFFLYVVDSWYWDIDGDYEDLLDGTLSIRKEDETLPEWFMHSNQTEVFQLQEAGAY